jgi:hypothetical protein
MMTRTLLPLLSLGLLAACGSKIVSPTTEDTSSFEPADGGGGGADGQDGGAGGDGASDGADGADGADGSDGATDGGSDGSSDGADGGTDGGGSGGGSDLDGVYTGGFVGSFTSSDGSIADTCSGTVVVDINTASSIPILSNVSCSWGGLMATLDPAPAFSFDGRIESDGSTVGGSVTIPTVALTTTWSGTVSGDTISGSYAGSGMALGLLDITYDGSFTASR